MGDPDTIVENNLSVAWAKAFIKVVETGEIAPLTVVIRGFENGELAEVQTIRELMDEALGEDQQRLSCHQVANTIFPSMWNPQADRQELYQRYLKILPRVLKDRRNRYGVYFQRLIAFEDAPNQLEHIITTWQRRNHRRTALQAAIFDPRKDHTHQPRRGFPCLQQVAFAPQGKHGLSVTGFYATQYVFRRAYGNYLGLCRLGRFMAQEMGLNLIQVTCVACPAVCDGDVPKSTVRGLAAKVREALEQI